MKNKNIEYIEKFFKEYEEKKKMKEIKEKIAKERAIEVVFRLSENFNKLKKWVIKNKLN